MTDNVRWNMTPAEREAWERGGGRTPSNVGMVYRPEPAPETPAQRDQRKRDEAAARMRRRRADPLAAVLGEQAEEVTRRYSAPASASSPADPGERARSTLPSRRAQALEAIEHPERVAKPVANIPRTFRAEGERPTSPHLVQADEAALARLEEEQRHHGSLECYLTGCRRLDCMNAANEAAMLGEYKP